MTMKIVAEQWAVTVWQEIAGSGYTNFYVAEIVSGTEETGYDMRLDGEPHTEDCKTTQEIQRAAKTITGMVRFDGAIHTYWNLDSDNYMCGDRASMTALGEVFAYVADEAKRLFLEGGIYPVGL